MLLAPALMTGIWLEMRVESSVSFMLGFAPSWTLSQ